MTVVIISFVCTLFLITTVVFADSNYDSAVCITQANQCSRFQARQSRGCMPFQWPMLQPLKCRNSACGYCRTRGKGSYPCISPGISKICSGTKQSSPTKAPTAPKPVSGCVYRARTSFGKTAIVINMGSLPAKGGWTRIQRNGLSGLIYRRDRGGGRDSAGKKGVYCFPMVTNMGGSYQFTAVSYTPHQTEHNDMWVRSSKGFAMWYEGRYWKSVGGREWLKAYQNVPGRFADYLHTKDWDPHKFIIPNVQAGKKFEVCISGRSYRYEVYRIIVKKCQGRECRGFEIPNIIKLPITPISC